MLHILRRFTSASNPLQVTRAAVNQIASIRANRGSESRALLRIGVETGGCAGYSYTFSIEEPPTDSPLGEEEVAIYSSLDDAPEPVAVLTKEAVPLVEGSTLDYVSELVRDAFVVVGNPHAVAACGCGVSFNAAPTGATGKDATDDDLYAPE